MRVSVGETGSRPKIMNIVNMLYRMGMNMNMNMNIYSNLLVCYIEWVSVGETGSRPTITNIVSML